jgi:uncharacterized protein (TIGR03437 family)
VVKSPQDGGRKILNLSFTTLRTAAFALLLPAAMFADFSQSPVLASGQTLNLDTGAMATSGGDIKFTGTSITLVGSATAYNIGSLGLPGFSAFPGQTSLQTFGPLYTTTAISGNTLAVNDFFAVYTNAGHYAEVLIDAVSSTSITLQFTTFGATGGASPGAPVISRIQNNYSNIIAGLPNYGIAPSTLFVVYGSGLADPSAQAVLQSSLSPGIPLTLNGASITVTVNGVVTHPAIYYAIAGQIAAVLPASTPVGTGTLTVTYNGLTSAAATLQVVPSALGFDTLSGLTNGTGVATDLTGALITFTNSASPGQFIVLWGSGLGADTADSDTVLSTTPHAVGASLTLYIGGIAVTASYAGSAGYPGVNQINVAIPSGVTPGCAVPITGVVGTMVTNTITVPVAANGGVCTDAVHGTDGNGLTSTQNQTTYTSATVAVAQANTATQQSSYVSGAFLKETGLQYAPGYGLVTVGGCLVLQGVTPNSTITYLDAGNLTITGPGGSLPITKSTASGIIAYELSLPTGYFGSSGGAYTVSGSGGADVGPFSVTVTDNNPLVWTNQSAIASVNRSQGVTVNWTGGIPGTYVSIAGGSTAVSASATFLCFAPVSAGTFTVPSYVTLAMPVASGGINLLNQSNPTTFSASGINYTVAVAEVEDSIGVPYN